MADLIFGLHAVQAVLHSRPTDIRRAWVLKGRDDSALQSILETLSQYGVSVEACARQRLDDKVEGNHQGIVVEAKSAPVKDEDWLLARLGQLQAAGEAPFLLVLDQVQDPHNLGACLRSADAVGVHAVVAPKDRSATLTATARKVACGAAETVPFVQVTNLARTLRSLKDEQLWVVGLAGEADAELWNTRLDGPLAVVMGAEGKGLRRLTREHCDAIASLPMHGLVDSLNVSVTTGVVLYEALRQRSTS
jgi:23S rRNA (guanosine2251-2'-O)-methyltransferase